MNTRAVIPDWIAVDWGTTHLRASAVAADGAILARADSDDGMGRLSRDAFEPALLRLVAPWLGTGRRTLVLACGMVGSRQGWHEAAYRQVPCRPLDASSLVTVPTRDARLDLRLVPGLSQMQPFDVMRGEETQIAGFLELNAGWSGSICLPGTHSKWADIKAAEVVRFQTFMTGELFALLSEQSVLRHGISADGWDSDAFTVAVQETATQPERLAATLFRVRAESLLAQLDPAKARARLSGLLIGLELGAARSSWSGRDVVIIATAGLSSAYAAALSILGVAARSEPGPDMVMAGLGAAFAAIRMETSR